MHTYFHYIFKIEDVDVLDYTEDDISKNLKDMLLGGLDRRIPSISL